MPTRRERIMEEMKAKLKQSYLSRDLLLVFCDNAVKDVERNANILFERLNEWYSIYFPELKIEDRSKYCNLVLQIDKENMAESKKAIMSVMGEKGAPIVSALETSAGTDLQPKDLEGMKLIAQQILMLEETEEQLNKYVDTVSREVCPNMAEVAGPKVAAMLIAHVGGLEKLAKLPASTIQVLGAEKALFKHLRKHTKPPKHGIIFQHSQIHSSPRDKRGKIARALAGKIAIAAKIDAYGKGHFMGKELRAQFEKRVQDILAEKVKPKPVYAQKAPSQQAGFKPQQRPQFPPKR
ncbi:putative NOP5 family protein [uncultured archaeon]|nr:putative NOP5 family protein [uncultured archaeon]